MFEMMCLVGSMFTSDAGACPICSYGFTEYYGEWECVDGQWTHEVVGYAEYNGACGNHFEMQWGEQTDCWLTQRDVGGGTEDADCVSAECDPRPTTRCPANIPGTPMDPPPWPPRR